MSGCLAQRITGNKIRGQANTTVFVSKNPGEENKHMLPPTFFCCFRDTDLKTCPHYDCFQKTSVES